MHLESVSEIRLEGFIYASGINATSGPKVSASPVPCDLCNRVREIPGDPVPAELLLDEEIMDEAQFEFIIKGIADESALPLDDFMTLGLLMILRPE